jgi:hypothetical protein
MTTIARTLVDGAESGDTLTSAVAGVLTRLPPVAVAGLTVPSTDLSAALSALLDVPIGNLALRGWQQRREVVDACRRTATEAGAREVLRLLDHRIVSRQSPTLEVLLDGVRVVLLELDLTVEIEVNGVDLVIEHGAVQDARPGSATARADLRAWDVVLAEHEFQPVDLDRRPAGPRPS